MNTFELLEELSKKPKEEIEFSLKALMIDNKIDFISLSNSYVQYLNKLKEDKEKQLINANLCIKDSFDYDNMKKSEGAKRSIQSRLYWLNKSESFNMQKLNEKYGYNEELGKEYCWYERNKKNKII